MLKALAVFLILHHATEAVILQCEFSRVNWYRDQTRYTCTAKSITFDGSNNVTAISGNHLPGMHDGLVEGISAYNLQPVSSIPKNLESFFPHLAVLQWYHGGIKTISSQDLRPFPNLRILYLGDNEITTLDGDLLQYSRNILAVHFINNKIEHVGRDLFIGLSSNILFIDFRNNPCINLVAEGPEQIQEMIELLPNHCEPLDPETSTTTMSTTTDANQCFARCSVDEEIDELKLRANDRDEIIENQNRKLSQITQKIAKFEARFEELEEQLRELKSLPCSCSRI